MVRVNSPTTKVATTAAYVMTEPLTGTADPCSLISTALGRIKIGTTSVYLGTVDARNLKGSTANICHANPFSVIGAGSAVRVLLGPTTIPTTAMWAIPAGVTIEGVGAGLKVTGMDAPGTVIQANSSTASPVIDLLGPGNIHLQDLVIDCVSRANIGIRNERSGLGTTLDRIRISGCKETGLEVATAGAADSGPYRDIYVTPGGGWSTTFATTCVGAWAVRVWRRRGETCRRRC